MTVIILNGEPVRIDWQALSYGDIVELAGMSGSPSVTYSTPARGDTRRSGTMHAGSPPLELEDDMAITVIHTGNA